MRVPSDKPGKTWGWIHKADEKTKKVYKLQPKPKQEKVDCLAWYRAAKKHEDKDKLIEFGKSLGVQALTLHALGCVWVGNHNAFAFPMYRTGELCGIRFRNFDGDKWALLGSHQGIFIPSILFESKELYIVEGPTDCAAALNLGFSAIGRPSCLGCENIISDFIRLKKIKSVTIVSDNDDPGHNGAKKLQATLKVPSCIWTPPTKDLRAFFKKGGDKETVESLVKNLEWEMPINRLPFIPENN